METYSTRENMDNKYRVTNPDILKATEAYPIAEVSVVRKPLKKVSDLRNGGMRNRRYGIVLALGALPRLEDAEEPLILTMDLPKVVIDGDTIEDLKKRVHAEIDAMFSLYQDTIDGRLSEDED
jgi:hypothetical protein